MMTRKLTTILLASTCGVALLSTAAMAQIEEIVVTTRKAEEKLQDIPLTVSAFSEAQIESAGIDNISDLQGFAPGLNLWQNVDRGYSQVLFRGMNNNAPTGDTSRDASSVFIDGVFYVGNISLINTDDIQRIEVVKGPQAAFFGRATFGGAINFITKDPGNTAKARFVADVATDEEYEVGGSVEGPLVKDRLAARVSINYRDFGGQYKNAVTGNPIGEEQDTSVSGSLVFTPTDNLTVKARVMYQQNDDGQAASNLVGQRPQHNCGPFGGTNNGQPATLFCGELKIDEDNIRLNENIVGQAATLYGMKIGMQRDFYFGTLSADLDIADGWTLSSLTGYTDEEQFRLFDFDRTGIDTYYSAAPRTQEAFSQEVRLASPQDQPLRGLIGGYYLWQDYMTAGNFIQGSFFGASAGTVILGTPASKTIKNTAIFGALSYDIMDNLTASFEGRYQRDKINARIPGFVVPSTTKTFLPRFIIDYKPTDDLTLYANVARGNKPTQANQDIVQQPANKQAILAGLQGFPTAPEEKIWNYEIGAKTVFWDGRGVFNIAAYYGEWRGKQGTKSIMFDFNGNGAIDLTLTGVNRENFNGVVYPAGDVNIKGTEIETSLAVTDNLTVSGNIAYNDSNIIKLEDEIHRRWFGTLDASGQEEPRVAKWQWTATLAYSDVLSGDINWFVRADEVFIGNKWESILNKAKTGPSYKTNVKLGIENGQYMITGYVNNLFNDKTIPSLQQQGDSALDPVRFALAAYEAVLPRQRQFGIKASYNF
jgi:iron complex outermembrane receptor protein